jgi:hypothetical protein
MLQLRYSSCGIQWAANASRTVAEDVGVDHGRRHLSLAEELMDGADVVIARQKMVRKRMAEGVATGTLVDTGRADGTRL